MIEIAQIRAARVETWVQSSATEARAEPGLGVASGSGNKQGADDIRPNGGEVHGLGISVEASKKAEGGGEQED